MPSSKFKKVHVNCATEAIGILLDLRSQSFFSFRGQRNHEWALGPHDIPPEWRTNIPIPDLEQESDNEIKGRETKALSMLNDEGRINYWKSKCVRRNISNNLSQYMKQIHAIDERLIRIRNDWWDQLIFAHHHNLRTLLLDWTSNPLVALYFAVENVLSHKNDDMRGAVYALKVKDKNKSSSNNWKRWHSIKEVMTNYKYGENCPYWVMINPPLNSDRIIRQSGKFSYHPSIEDDYLINNGDEIKNLVDGEMLIKIVIGNDTINPTQEIRRELGIMNVHHGSLFPDDDGFAHYINIEWRDIATDKHFYSNLDDRKVKSDAICEVREFLKENILQDQ
jgi:hypothetical protein